MSSRPVKKRRVMSNGIPSTPYPQTERSFTKDINDSPTKVTGASFANGYDSDDSSPNAAQINGANGMEPPSQSSSSFQGFSDNRDMSDDASSSEDKGMSDDGVDSVGDDENSHDSTDEDEDAAKNSVQQSNLRSKSQRSNSAGFEHQPIGSIKTNVMKLQIDEMLRRVKPHKDGQIVDADSMLRRLKDVVEKIPNTEPLTFDEAEKKLRSSKTAYPYPKSKAPRNSNIKVQYMRPSKVNVVGGYALKTTVKQNEPITIDFVVEMPSALFTEKDFLDHRYFQKRAFYVAWISASLRKDLGVEVTIKFDYFNGNTLKPIITIEPKLDDKSLSKAYMIQIIPCVKDGTFDTAKLAAERNSIRPTNMSSDSSVDLPQTPYYNSSILEDCKMMEFHKHFCHAQATSKSFRDACVLGRVWLRQRGFDSTVARGGFGHFEWAALIANLLEENAVSGKPVLSPVYDSLQMFRATLSFLARENLVKSYRKVDVEASLMQTPALDDTAQKMNTMFRMSPWSYKILRKEAQATVKTFSNNPSSALQSAFIFKINEPRMKYDFLMKIPLSALELSRDIFDQRSALELSCYKLYRILARGLSDRITTIDIALPATQAWSIQSSQPAQQRDDFISIGLAIDPSKASRLVDRGPSAESKSESDEFRKFWGSKAELRRFKDGEILHSVVWTGGPATSILQEIVVHLIETHISADAASRVTFVQHDVEASSLSQTPLPKDNRSFEPIMTAYRDLERTIRDLEGLPLEVRQMQPAGALLSYTSATSDTSLHQMQPADIILQLESSGRWPDDLTAIQATKTAFLLKIADLLTASSNTSARVGMENTDSPYLNKPFLDITHSTIPFRLRIHHDREPHLLTTLLSTPNPANSLTPTARTAAAHALASHRRTYTLTPLHTAATTALTTRHPAFAATSRLLKSWLSAHHLTLHIRPQLTELLVARVFLHPDPWLQTPGTAITGLLRALLFLSRWDWTREPLIVEFSSAATSPTSLGGSNSSSSASQRREELTKRFDAWRQLDPRFQRVALFAASDIEGDDGTAWTTGGGAGSNAESAAAQPSVVVANRMVALASAAVKHVAAKGLDLHLADIFASPLQEYDFVLRIAGKFVPGGGEGEGKKKRKFKNLEVAALEGGLVGYDPVGEYVAELQRVFGEAVVFFYGGFGRSVVAGLWEPEVTRRRRWKVALGWSSVPLRGDGENDEEGEEEEEKVVAELNKEAMIAEMVRLGGDLIEGVDVNRH